MDTTHLGHTGVAVSRLCLGTMNFGAHASEAESHAIMDAALTAGVQFFDTANVYGGKAGKGASEQIVGRWLRSGNRREQVVLATKVYGRMGDGPNERGLSARHVRAACEASLRRLGTDHIDLYQMHHADLPTAWDEVWQAMELLVQQGKVLYVGSSNFAAWQLTEMHLRARQHGRIGLVSEQSIYSLAQRSIELEVLPACRHFGIGVLPWSPLAGGLLGGVLRAGNEGRRAADGMRADVEQRRKQLQAWEGFCAERGAAPAVVALAWTLHQPGVTAPIIGPRTRAQLEQCLQAASLVLDAGALSALDEIWPGPGGEAPAAYAW